MNQLLIKSNLNRVKPFIAIVLLQFALAGMDIISKKALNEGMSPYVFVVYDHAIATIVIAPFAIILDRETRPKMTLPTFFKLVMLSLLEPTIDQNLYYLGMKYTTATFAAAMVNILPAITFVMAWICRLERVKLKRFHSQAKIIGTVATVAGAMVMTLVAGPVIKLPWTNEITSQSHGSGLDLQHSLKGGISITIGCFCWAGSITLQAITLETYPVELSLTAWICLLGTAESAVVALVVERNNFAAWSLGY